MKSMRMSSHSLKANDKALVKLRVWGFDGEIAILLVMVQTYKESRINQSIKGRFIKSANENNFSQTTNICRLLKRISEKVDQTRNQNIHGDVINFFSNKLNFFIYIIELINLNQVFCHKKKRDLIDSSTYNFSWDQNQNRTFS